MTSLLLNQIPSNIDTVEKLHVWTSTVLAQVNPTTRILEQENIAEFVAKVFVLSAFEGTVRLIDRISIPIDPSYVSDKSKKFWEFAKPISDTVLPTSFTTN